MGNSSPPKNLTEVSEKSDVSVLGIPPVLLGPSLVLVKKVSSTEPKLTRKFIESVKVKEEELKTMLPPKSISLKRTLPQWVDSLITVLLEKTSSSSRDAALVLKRDSSFSVNPWPQLPAENTSNQSTLNSSIPHPNSATVVSKPQNKECFLRPQERMIGLFKYIS